METFSATDASMSGYQSGIPLRAGMEGKAEASSVGSLSVDMSKPLLNLAQLSMLKNLFRESDTEEVGRQRLWTSIVRSVRV